MSRVWRSAAQQAAVVAAAIARGATISDQPGSAPLMVSAKALAGNVEAARAVPAADGKPRRAGKRRREMNGIERQFARLLEARVARGEIVSFEYEGLTLRWADGMRYTPDFMIVESITYVPPITEHSFCHQRIILAEIKGAYAWRQDVVKFRAARANWPLFEFQYWQQVDGEWQQTR